MTTKKNPAACAVDGSMGQTYVNVKGRAKKVGVICGHIRMDGNCGAHGNKKCVHKVNCSGEAK